MPVLEVLVAQISLRGERVTFADQIGVSAHGGSQTKGLRVHSAIVPADSLEEDRVVDIELVVFLVSRAGARRRSRGSFSALRSGSVVNDVFRGLRGIGDDLARILFSVSSHLLEFDLSIEIGRAGVLLSSFLSILGSSRSISFGLLGGCISRSRGRACENL